MSNIRQITWGANQAANLPGGLHETQYYDGTYRDANGSTVCCALRPTTARDSGKMVVGMVKALLRAAQVQTTAQMGGYAIRTDAAGAVEYSLGEYVDTNDHFTNTYNNEPVTIVAYEVRSKNIYATKTVTKGTTSGSVYEFKTNQSSGAPLFFALMPLLLDDPEFASEFSIFCRESRTIAGGQISVAGAESLMKLCDNMYYQLKQNTIDCDMDGVSMLVQRRVESNRLSADMDKITGEITVFTPNATTTANQSTLRTAVRVDPAAFRFSYAIRDDLTDEEKDAVETIEKTYIMPPQIIDACELIQQSQEFAQPIREVLMYGPPGSGKTEGARAMASGLGLPYYFMTCHAHMEIFDLVGSFMPAGGDEKKAITIREVLEDCPDFMEIAMDPVASYRSITGQPKLDATEKDCMLAIYKKAAVLIEEHDSEQRYTFVESALVKAMRQGYVIELQEPSLILNSGVLPGLNGLLDTTMKLQLANHQTLVRHPKSIFIATTNFDLEGCRQINQAFYSRLKLKVKMDTPEDVEIIKRVKAISGYDDDAELSNMLVVMKSIRDRCVSESIVDGSIGVREFADWAMVTRINNDPYKAALYTIIPSASTDERNQGEFVSGILQQHYPATA